MRHLGMELDSVHLAGMGLKGRDGQVAGGRDRHETGRGLVDVVAVRAPDGDGLAGIEAVEEVAALGRGVAEAGVGPR